MNNVAHEIIKQCLVSFALLLPVNLLPNRQRSFRHRLHAVYTVQHSEN